MILHLLVRKYHRPSCLIRGFFRCSLKLSLALRRSQVAQKGNLLLKDAEKKLLSLACSVCSFVCSYDALNSAFAGTLSVEGKSVIAIEEDSKKVQCHSVMPYRPRLEFDPPMNSSSYAYYLNSLTGMANPRKEFTSTTASSQSFDGDTSAYSRLFLFP
ncbi:hypothetical protein LguiA_036043 [Lonicera macranthoides]